LGGVSIDRPYRPEQHDQHAHRPAQGDWSSIFLGNPLVNKAVELRLMGRQQALAEGVEHAYELAFLKREQCESAQGFLLSRPLDDSAIDAFIQKS
jgi:hypothetical protein